MKKLSSIKQVTGEITARKAHNSNSYVPVCPRTGPRTARPSRRVYIRVEGWLRRHRGSGWARVGHLADVATVELGLKVSPSVMGYVIQRVCPEIPMRMTRIKKDNRFQTVKSSTEYDMSFLTRYLDGDIDVC